MSAQHTPTPWKVATRRHDIGVRTVMSPTKTPDLNIRVADVLEDADAAFIVRACNAFGDTLTALELIEHNITTLTGAYPERYARGDWDGTLAIVRAAPAKAKGETR